MSSKPNDLLNFAFERFNNGTLFPKATGLSSWYKARCIQRRNTLVINSFDLFSDKIHIVINICFRLRMKCPRNFLSHKFVCYCYCYRGGHMHTYNTYNTYMIHYYTPTYAYNTYTQITTHTYYIITHLHMHIYICLYMHACIHTIHTLLHTLNIFIHM